MSDHDHDHTYDFVILGGGSAGYAAARTAADLGLKTAVVDGAEELGGLCILRGCMPSKTLIESANRMLAMREAAEFGLRADGLRAVPAEIIARKRRLIGEFASYRQGQLESGRFALIRGRGRYAGAESIRIDPLGGGEAFEITARTSLIATGSAVTPASLIPGLDEVGCLISDDVLDTPHIPASIIVLGGGAIALELAHYYSGVGAQVTVIQRSDHVLSSLDRDLGEVVEEAFRERGMEVFTGTNVTGAEAADGGRKRIRFEHGGAEKIVEAEEILFALGRQPNVEGLALDQAGVARDGRRVETDAAMRTSAPNIFAAGDTTSRVEVVHLAIEQGEAAAHNAALHLGKIEGAPKEISYRLKLLGIFTEPQVASVGLSEAECQAEGIPHRAAKYPFDDHGKSMVAGVRHGFVKLIAHAETGVLLGGSVAGPEATELIHEIVVAMRFNATARQLATTPHYHPTLSEIWTYPAEELADEIG